MTKVTGLFCELQPWLGYGSAVGRLPLPNIPPGTDEPSAVRLSEPESWCWCPRATRDPNLKASQETVAGNPLVGFRQWS